ncbi:MAG: ComF family protein [Myxococcaceae bacterium]|nr:ComF family protein [Myxococcaceae bacterium]
MSWVTDLLFPPACVACARVLEAEGFFCAECAQQVEPLPDEHCPRCAEPGEFPPGRVCQRCTERPPPFVRAFAPFTHGGAIARAIHELKYEDHPELARPLGTLLAKEARAFLDALPVRAVVAAIPLHRRRLEQRRYDQAELLAVELAGRTGRRHLVALERTKATQRQVGLSEAARDANVSGAFAARAEVAGEDVLLVDDVFTTGATARAAAGALKAAGAASVHVLTLARAFTL